MANGHIHADEEVRIRKALERCGGVGVQAAKDLGMPTSSFFRRLRRFGIEATGRGGRRAAVATRVPVETPTSDTHPGMIILGNRRTSAKKPAQSVKSKLYELPKGRGFPIHEAAREWGVGVETLRRHARDVDAVCFVEATPENWVEVVTYPKRG